MQSIEREVFVISDLHIGGCYGTNNNRGFRINTHIDDLASFIDEVRVRSENTSLFTELVINGDFLDFLAEESLTNQRWQAFISDEKKAVEAFDTIANRDKVVFDALRTAIQSGISLTILLGNHDVELSLPAVRTRLNHLIGDRCKFLYDGEAYVIGDVLIEHGNRYDGFNVIDHDSLRRLRSTLSRQLPVSHGAEFHPPPGSLLVEKVMNPIKENYAFIDLLKPETEAVIPLLIALEPGFALDIERMWNVYTLSGEAKKRAPSEPGLPACPENIHVRENNQNQTRGLNKLLMEHMGKDELNRLMKLVKQVDNKSKEISSQIGFRENALLAWSLLKLTTTSNSWKNRLEVLLDALRQIQNDTSFNRSIETKEYLTHANELASRGFRVIVFGHTHLAKEISIKHDATYLNTGTWADLMQVPAEILSTSPNSAITHLENFVAALKTGDFHQYIKFSPTFAHITLNSNEKVVSAKLQDFENGKVSNL